MKDKSVVKVREDRGFIAALTMLEELEKDLEAEEAKKEDEIPSGKEAILEVLARAADDHKFLARLAETPSKVVQEYDLTLEQKAALISGDMRRIEHWVGKLDKRLSTWIWCRLQQSKW